MLPCPPPGRSQSLTHKDYQDTGTARGGTSPQGEMSPRWPWLPTWVILHHDRGHGPVAGVVGVVRLAVGVAVHVGDVGLMLCEG